MLDASVGGFGAREAPYRMKASEHADTTDESAIAAMLPWKSCGAVASCHAAVAACAVLATKSTTTIAMSDGKTTLVDSPVDTRICSQKPVHDGLNMISRRLSN